MALYRCISVCVSMFSSKECSKDQGPKHYVRVQADFFFKQLDEMQQMFEKHETAVECFTSLDRILSGHKFPIPLGTDDISPLGDPLAFHAFDSCLAEKEIVQETI